MALFFIRASNPFESRLLKFEWWTKKLQPSACRCSHIHHNNMFTLFKINHMHLTQSVFTHCFEWILRAYFRTKLSASFSVDSTTSLVRKYHQVADMHCTRDLNIVIVYKYPNHNPIWLQLQLWRAGYTLAVYFASKMFLESIHQNIRNLKNMPASAW